jgi:hypothetical protein
MSLLMVLMPEIVGELRAVPPQGWGGMAAPATRARELGTRKVRHLDLSLSTSPAVQKSAAHHYCTVEKRAMDTLYFVSSAEPCKLLGPTIEKGLIDVRDLAAVAPAECSEADEEAF